MKLISSLLMLLCASVFGQTGDNTEILYEFKDALWLQTSIVANDTGSPGTFNGTILATDINQVTFRNNSSGGTAINYSITANDAKISGVTVDWGSRFVLEARIKKSALVENGTDSEIYIIKNTAATGLSWYIDTNKKMVLKVGDGTSINVVSQNPVISDDQWMIVGAVIDLNQATIDDAVKFYKNNQPASYTGYSLLYTPNHTDYTSTFGTVTSDSEYSTAYLSWKAFDGYITSTHAWLSGNNAPFPHWLKYTLDSSVSGKLLAGYRIMNNATVAAAPKDWTFRVDGNVVDTQTGQVFTATETKEYLFSEPVQVNTDFELNISANNGYSYTAIQEFEPIWVVTEQRSKILTAVDTSATIIPTLNSTFDQGYQIITSDAYSTAYDGTGVFNFADASNWYFDASDGEEYLKVLFDAPKNVSGLKVLKGYHNSYNGLPETFKIALIQADDSERFVYIGRCEKDKLITFHSENDIKGIKFYADGPAHVGFGNVEVYSGAYVSAQPQNEEATLTGPQGYIYGTKQFIDNSNTVIYADSTYSTYVASRIIDGSDTTYWESNSTTGWFKIEYPSAKAINGFYLKQDTATNYQTNSVKVYIDDVLVDTVAVTEMGYYLLSATTTGSSIKLETDTPTVTKWRVEDFAATYNDPYYSFAPPSQLMPVALDENSTYTAGTDISGENPIELLQKTGDFSLSVDTLKMTVKRTVGTFDPANFTTAEGFKVDENYNVLSAVASNIHIYPPKLLRRVHNPSTDFTSGQPNNGVTVDVDTGSGNKVFYGMFQMEFALDHSVAEASTIDVYIKTTDFDFKKVAEITPTPKPGDPNTPWVIKYYWNSRAAAFNWDGNAYKSSGPIQMKLDVR